MLCVNRRIRAPLLGFFETLRPDRRRGKGRRGVRLGRREDLDIRNRLLGRDVMEAELLKEALDLARERRRSTGFSSGQIETKNRSSTRTSSSPAHLRRLALQLRFCLTSESMGDHDSEVMDERFVDRSHAGTLGVVVAGGEGADPSVVQPGTGRSVSRIVSGWLAWRRAAQDGLDARRSGRRSRSVATAGDSRAWTLECRRSQGRRA